MDLFTTLVTYDHIRSAAGVSEHELTNTEVDNSGLDTDLELEVSEWLPSSTSLTQIYDTGIDLAATQQQKLQMYAMSAYLKYTSAYLLFLTGVIRFSKKISDSANLMERNQWTDEKVLRNLKAQADKYKNKFLELFDQPADEFDTAIFMGAVPPDYDPVTNT